MAGPGAPTNYNPDICPDVIDMGTEGLSTIQIAARLGLTHYRLLQWADRHEELGNALELAKTYSQACWEDQLIERTWSDEINSANVALAKMQLQSRFPDAYRDRTDNKTDMQVGVFEIDFTGMEPPSESED